MFNNEKFISLEKDSYHKFKKNKKFRLFRDYFYIYTRNKEGKFNGCNYYRLNDYELTREEREKREKELYDILLEVKLLNPVKAKKKI